MDDKAPSGAEPLSPVEVEIGGRTYRLRGSDPEHLARLAAEVDGTLREIAGAGGPVEDFKVAVLAALNLAADHDDERKRWAHDLAALRERTEALERRLESLARRVEGDGSFSV